VTAAPRFAEPGTIPALGEVWQPVGPTMTLLTAHLVPIAAVRPLVPRGLSIVPVWPGYTLGSTLLSYYGPESTLEYHELVVAGALVRYGRTIAPFVTHIYVDSERSVTGGRRMGLPKELALFDWNGRAPGVATLSLPSGTPLCAVRYGAPGLGMSLRLAGPTISVIGDAAWHFRSGMRGRWGLTSAHVEIPPASPVAQLRMGRALAAVACGPMRGEMGLGMRPLGPLNR
jgi:hypothetical protein